MVSSHSIQRSASARPDNRELRNSSLLLLLSTADVLASFFSGPCTVTQYFHGLREASLSDADSKQRLKIRGIQEGSTIFPFPDKVADRFHLDLLVITDHILRRLYPLYEVQAAVTVKLLESSHTSTAYAKQIEQGPPNGLRDPALGHSGLFTFCANVSTCYVREAMQERSRNAYSCRPVCPRVC